MVPINIEFMETIKDKGFEEVVLLRNATVKEYEKALEFLTKSFVLNKRNLINDFDSYYFVFELNGGEFILFYSNFTGISLYCEKTTAASPSELQTLHEIAKQFDSNSWITD